MANTVPGPNSEALQVATISAARKRTPEQQRITLSADSTSRKPAGPFLRDHSRHEEVRPVVLDRPIAHIRVAWRHIVFRELRRQCRVPEEIGGEVRTIEPIALRILRAEIFVRKHEHRRNDNSRRIRRALPSDPTLAARRSGCATSHQLHEKPSSTAQATTKVPATMRSRARALPRKRGR